MKKGEKLEPSFTVFEALLGNEFSVQAGDQVIRFKLVEVTQLPPITTQTDLGIRQDRFALLLKEVTEFQPDQGIFAVNIGGDTVDMFLVPVGMGVYEAIFS